MSGTRVYFLKPDEVNDGDIAFAVIAARMDDRWLYCRHRLRSTWEIPGGHREAGESCEDAARRELYEETGALEYVLTPICVYGVQRHDSTTYGMLYFAQVARLGALPEMEIAEIKLFVQPPQEQTYPNIQPMLWEQTVRFLQKEV